MAEHLGPWVWLMGEAPWYAPAMHSAPTTARHRRCLSLFALLVVFSAMGPVACGAPREGLGLGRPDFTGRGHLVPLGISITRLAAPSPSRTTPAFIELINNGNQPINTATNRLWLQTIAGSIVVPEMVWAPGQAVLLKEPDILPLDLHSTAGELIVLGESLNLEAYAAWGADPNTLPGGLNRLARSQSLQGDWQPLPYPLADTVAINLDAQNSAACVTADTNAMPPYAAALCQQSNQASTLWLSRIQPIGTDPNGPAIEVFNASSAALDVHAVQLCSRNRCRPIVPLNQSPNSLNDTWLPPSDQSLSTKAFDPARRRIVLAGGTALSPNDLVTDLPAVGSADEVALLAPGQALNEAGQVLSYVRLSTSPNRLLAPQTLAQSMGNQANISQWQNVTLMAPIIAGETLALHTGDPNAPFAPTAWSLDDAPFATVLADSNAPYTACSAPKTPQMPSDLIVAQVTSLGDQGLVILTNLGASAIALDGWSLAQGPNFVIALSSASGTNAVPLTTLASKGTLRVAIATNCIDPYNICWSTPGVALASGEVSLLQDGVIRGHVQWGDAALPSLFGAAAVAAGAWPATGCRASAFTGTEDLASLVRLPAVDGQSSADFALGQNPIGTDIYVAAP